MREVPPTAGLPLRWRDFLPRRRSFAEELAAFLGVPRVQFTSSGTAALIVALQTLQRRSGRRSVVIPAYTCPLVALAVLHCGLKPVVCDVRAGHFELDPEALANVVDDDTLAIVPTHLGGRVARLDGVLEIARQCGAAVIEDAAQSLGAMWRGKAVGTFGDAGFYSLAAGKGLTTYEGGVLLSRDEATLPSSPLWELRRFAQLAGYCALYRPRALRFAYGTRLRAALKRGKLIEAVGDDFSDAIPFHSLGRWRQAVAANALQRLPPLLEQLSVQAATRSKQLAGVIGDPEEGRGTWPFFMVVMPSESARDAALARLWTAGLGVSRLFIHALPDYPYLAARVRGNVPNARDFAARMLTVSNSPWLDDAGFQRIVDVIAESSRSFTR